MMTEPTTMNDLLKTFKQLSASMPLTCGGPHDIDPRKLIQIMLEAATNTEDDWTRDYLIQALEDLNVMIPEHVRANESWVDSRKQRVPLSAAERECWEHQGWTPPLEIGTFT